MTVMGNTREHLEAGRGVSSHIGNFLQSGGAGGDIVRNGDVGLINGHGEELSRSTYGFLIKCDKEKGKEEFGRDLETVGGRELTEGRGDTGSKDVHQQDKTKGGSVGGPPARIRILCATGDRL